MTALTKDLSNHFRTIAEKHGLPTHHIMGNTRAAAGLRVQAELDDAEYLAGVKVTQAEWTPPRLVPADFHGDWDYKLVPRCSWKLHIGHRP